MLPCLIGMEASGIWASPAVATHAIRRRIWAKALNRFAIVARLRLVLSDISMEEIVGSGGRALS
jgi:hypothetical protein